jgi:nonribosomal peptide synthetase DhbF
MVAATPHTLPDGSLIDCMNPGETEIIYREIFDEKVYARHGIEIRDGDIVLDIGANIGLFALFVSRSGARANLFCFEPAPATFAVLERNVARHALQGVRLFNAGIAGGRGEAVLQFMPNFTVSSTFRPDDSAEQAERNEQFTINAIETSPNRLLAAGFRLLPRFVQRPIARAVMRAYAKRVAVACPLLSVSDVIRDHGLERIDLLKVDAEGIEDEILAGIAPEHWPLIRQVTVEVHRGPEQLAAAQSLLAGHGFTTVVEASPASPAEPMIYARRPAGR